MAKAKKLPSGSWRVLAYSHTDADGKQHRISFTGSTKAEAEAKAAQYANNKKRIRYTDLTVGEAIDGYIHAKEGVLSPRSIRDYTRIRHHDFKSIENKRIRSLTSEDLQLFVSDLSRRLAPKTVRNIYGLLTASLSLYAPDITFRVSLPAKDKKRPVSPSDDDIRRLYETAHPKLKICLGFAMCGMRRGEFCALKYEDITDGIAHIHADIIQDKNNKWIYKDRPKTGESDRYVKLPQFVLDLIGEGEGFIVYFYNPNSVTQAFIKHRNRLGINIRLHDIRHFYASSAAILQIPDIYVEDMGGWRRGSSVMKSVYQNNIQSMSDYYADKMNDHLTKIIK